MGSEVRFRDCGYSLQLRNNLAACLFSLFQNVHDEIDQAVPNRIPKFVFIYFLVLFKKRIVRLAAFSSF